MRDAWITDWPVSGRFPHYTRANAGEVLADPVSPLGWSLVWMGAIVPGYRDGLISLGAYEADDFDAAHPETVATFGGYFYINLSAIRMQGARNPLATVEALDKAFFGDHPDVPAYVAHPDDAKPHLAEGIAVFAAWAMGGAGDWPELLDDRERVAALRAARPDLGALTSLDLVERARRLLPEIEHLFVEHVRSGSAAAMAAGMLSALGDALGDATLPMVLVAGIGDVDSAEASYAVWELSRLVRGSATLSVAFDEGVTGLLERLRAEPSAGTAQFLERWDDFLVAFGSRGPNEWDIVAPSWETHPDLALAAVVQARRQSDDQAPGHRHAARVADRERLTAHLRERLAGQPDLLGLLEGGLAASRMMAFRERTKTTIVKAIHEIRMAMRELGRRAEIAGHLDDAQDVFLLLADELDDMVADPSGFRELLAARRAEWDELGELEPPFIIANGEVPPLPAWRRRVTATVATARPGVTLTGVPGCPGVARGRARVLLSAADPSALEPGDILVAPSTDPSWTPLFLGAGGVVVDVGGQISHAVIVSRELGLPCVVSVTDATRRIPDGAIVVVDGTAGTVQLVADDA